MTINPTDRFYLTKEEPNKGCLLTLRSIILQQDDHVTETVKYGMPCFCYKNKMFCYLWIDKKTNEPYVLFVEGQKLNHPKLVSGSRKRMKSFPLDPQVDIPIKTLNMLLKKALEIYKKSE